MEDCLRKDVIEDRFYDLYGAVPEVWAQAPGRVDLMGSHTDYNEGYVLTEAIDRNTWIAAVPRSDRIVRIASLNSNGNGVFELGDIRRDEQAFWTNYVRGVADVFQKEGYTLQGFDGLIHSTVPFSSGLSSSAALEVTTAVLFVELCDLNIDPVRLARMCQMAENEFVGMNCGILDQYSSVMGNEGEVLLLDCRYIHSDSRRMSGNLQVVICDTRAERALTGSEYPERRAQCELGAHILSGFYPQVKTLRDASLEQLEAHADDLPEVVMRRCRFVIEENQRVLEMAEALAGGDHERIGSLAYASYAGARDLYEISCWEMESMITAMISGPGVIGARQAGAGFGGCMVAFVKKGEIEAFGQHVREHYKAHTGIEPKVFPVVAAAGAGILNF